MQKLCDAQGQQVEEEKPRSVADDEVEDPA